MQPLDTGAANLAAVVGKLAILKGAIEATLSPEDRRPD